MVLPIYLYGQDVLREDAQAADLEKKEEISALIGSMWETLAKADGCGLAAPQVGVSKRIFIVDGTVVADTYDYLKDFKRTMINPQIIEESAETCSYSESCLSVPGIYAEVRRPEKITIRYWNENFEEVTETLDKFAARIVQHEYEHLGGGLFVDNLAPIRKKMITKKLLGIAKGKVSTHYKTK